MSVEGALDNGYHTQEGVWLLSGQIIRRGGTELTWKLVVLWWGTAVRQLTQGSLHGLTALTDWVFCH